MTKQTILVIDDNPANLSVITQFLGEYNFEVLVAVDGKDGLETAETIQPDLILLDIVMPDMDGYEVCRRLKNTPRTQEIPVIFLTSIVCTEDKVKGFEVGAVDYLTKPVQAEEILARVHTHLQMQELTQRLQDANTTLTKRTRLLEINSQIAQKISSILDLDVLLKTAVESVRQAFDYYFVGVWLLNPSHKSIVLKSCAGLGDELPLAPDFAIDTEAPQSILSNVFRSGEPHLANDVAQPTHYLPLPELPLTRSELAIPLRAGQEILGALDIQSNSLNAFDPEDIPIMQVLTDQIAIAVRNAQLYELEKRLRHEEEEKTQQLAELNANKDNFFSIVAHDLRGPFQPLLSWSYILSKKNTLSNPQQVQDIAQNLYRAAKEFARLLENLLEWARIQQGRLEHNPTRLNLHTAAKNNISVLDEMATNKNIQVSNDIDTALHIYADENMVNAIIRNLLSNALKFTPEGGKVILTGAATLSDPAYVEIKVSDSGVGIPPKNIAKLFNTETHHTTLGTNREHGTGLGLSLCKDMIERHGGQIWVESTFGEGTTVSFTLPADKSGQKSKRSNR